MIVYRYRVCPVCEPDPGEDRYDTMMDAIAAYGDEAEAGCWRCEGHGLLIGEPDTWEEMEGGVVYVREEG